MTNGTAPPVKRPQGAKLTIEVYTISKDGVVSSPRTTVVVPHEYEPALEPLHTQLAHCACPIHRAAGVAR
ncbi:hypothetical protein [Streptomyces sp. HC307]|uniref:hypothetical protein n=1 Tax=Streptomyces flavusporus TaxID=3385496 RepID=UPI003916F146